MTRDEIIFQIGYSARLERMQSHFLNRVDRVATFLQILLGAAVITNTHPVATGIVVTTLAAFSFTYQPGVKAVEARLQKQRYEKLLSKVAELDEKELSAKYGELQENDSHVIGSLMHPAHFGECVRLGSPPTYRLTLKERIFAFAAGDLPRL